jgi:mycobactin peptide synthetase MbtE
VQQRLLFSEQLLPGQADYHAVGAYELNGPLQIDALREALQDVMGRHEVLRSVYIWDPVSPHRLTLERTELPDPLQLVALPEDVAQDDTERMAQRLCADWWETPFDLAEAPPLRARLANVGQHRHLLCFDLHHIAFDGWSTRLLWSDIATAYAARITGLAPVWPPTSTYHQYIQWERERLADWLSQDIPFWMELLGSGIEPPLVTQGRGPAAPESATDECSTWWSADQVQSLQQRVSEAKCSVLGLLLAAVGNGLGPPAGNGAHLLGTVISGRWQPAHRTVIGCFVNPVPVSVPYLPLGGISEQAAAGTRGLLTCLRHARTPFDEVSRALFKQRRQRLWLPVAGQVSSRPVMVPAPRSATPMTIETLPQPDGSWRLRTRWRREVVDPAIPARISAELVRVGG